MKKTREKEIALILISEVIKKKAKDGIKLGPRLYKETTRLAKETGIPKKELVIFLKGQLKSVFKNALKR